MTIKRCDGVYDPDDDSYLFLNIEEIKGNVIEIGSGTGIITLHYAKKGCNITAVDISGEAVVCTRNNAVENGLKVNVIRTNLFDGICNLFDFCIFNPPYLPSEFPDDPAWTGGKEGNEMIKSFIKEGQKHCRILYYLESSIAPIDKEYYSDLKFNNVRSITYDFEQLTLVRVETNAKYR
ncbi:MAG: HemK2/MTQ2 family protein methyltransferase [Thermoplasmata archaeon]